MSYGYIPYLVKQNVLTPGVENIFWGKDYEVYEKCVYLSFRFLLSYSMEERIQNRCNLESFIIDVRHNLIDL